MIIQDSPLVGLFLSADWHLRIGCEQGKQKKQGAPLAIMIDQADAHMSARSLCAEIIVLFPFSEKNKKCPRRSDIFMTDDYNSDHVHIMEHR